MPCWGFTRYMVGQWGASLSQLPLELNVAVWLNVGKWQVGRIKKRTKSLPKHILKRGKLLAFLFCISFTLVALRCDAVRSASATWTRAMPQGCGRRPGSLGNHRHRAALGPWKPCPPRTYHGKQKGRYHDGTTALGGLVVIVVKLP